MIYDFDGIIDRKKDLSAKYNELSQKYGKEDLLPLWIADMDFPVAKPIVDAMKERLSMGAFGYTTRPDFYNEAIVDWFKQRHGWEIESDWLMFSPGVVPSISLLIQNLTERGDRILIQQPVYSPFFNVVKDNERTPVVSELVKDEDGRYNMDFEDLEEKLSDAKMMVLCSPHNPVGRVWTRDELERLGEICLKKGVRIISDEIHCDLVFGGSKHYPMAGISKEIRDITITCLAPSKTFNIPGLQASMIVMPKREDYEAMEKSFSIIDIKRNNCFSLVATHAAYSKCSGWVDQLNSYIEENADFVCEYIENEIPRLRVKKPEGTFLMWIDCSGLGLCDEEIKSFMIEDAKLALSDGSGFGLGGSGYQRINIACPRSVLKEALSRLKKAVDKLECK